MRQPAGFLPGGQGKRRGQQNGKKHDAQPPARAASTLDNFPVNLILIHMRTAAIRDLRTRFPKLEAWLRQGEPISITKHGVHVASLVPAPAVGKRGRTVDFAAQMKRIWGERRFSDAEARNMIRAARDEEEG